MLWRQHYDTKILRNLALPVVEVVRLDAQKIDEGPKIYIGGFGFNGTADQGVWWRLFRSDFPGDPRVFRTFLFDSVSRKEIETAASLVSPSEARQTCLFADPMHLFQGLLVPDELTRGFALINDGNAIPLAMVGPPTEDAWEEFSSEWKART